MFLVDKPYVSEFFKKTVRDHKIPIVDTPSLKDISLYEGTNIITEEQAVELVKKDDSVPIYCVSENSISWIITRLYFTDLPKKIEFFKDKIKFRRLIRPLFPDFYFKELSLDELDKVDLNNIPLPFIIKPAVGFMSIGVHKVSSYEQYKEIIKSINQEIESSCKLYPPEVLDKTKFIIEEYINGDEFAIDAYYDSCGKIRIFNIFNHVFSSDSDVRDRLYISSKRIIEENLEDFSKILQDIGNLADIKIFPIHVELRRDNNNLIPLEINPMRFGGWCTTPDITYLSYGFNPYVYYYSQKFPDWQKILKEKDDKIFAIIVLDNSTGIPGDKIKSFNYEKLLSMFEKPLELRKVDFKKFPLFGILFTETREDNFDELKYILNSNLSEFIHV